MLGFMLTTIAETSGRAWRIRTAGTHVTEGSAMSGRTRDALLKIDDLGDHRYGAHRSHQLDAADTEWADVMLAAELDNVTFVRSNFSSDADKAVQIAQFVRVAPHQKSLHTQLLAMSSHEPLAEFNVADPAGGEQSIYDECARQLWDLARAFSLIVVDRTD
jgi:protein-tyrosine-phosphatase